MGIFKDDAVLEQGGGDTLWTDDNSTLKMITERNLNLQSKGLIDTNLQDAIKLGDELNTSFLTTNKTIVGATNEILDRLNQGFTNISQTFDIETKILDSFADNLQNRVIYEYEMNDGTNSRAGTFTINWNSTTNNVSFLDESLEDIGSTAGITLSADIINNLVRLIVVSSLPSFTFKAVKRFLYQNLNDVNNPENTIIVKTAEDFGPIQPDGMRHLTVGKIYDLNNNVVFLTETLLIPNDINGTSVIIRDGIILYAGGQFLFKSSEDFANITVCLNVICQGYDIGYGYGTFLDVNLSSYNKSLFLISTALIINFENLGIFNNIDFYSYFCDFRGIGNGFECSKSEITTDIRFVSNKFREFKNNNTSIIELINMKGSLFLSLNNFDTKLTTNTYVINIDSLTLNIDASINIFANIFNSSSIFYTGSLDGKHPQVNCQSNSGLYNSTSLTQSYCDSINSLTSVTNLNQIYPLVGVWSKTIIEDERFTSNSAGEFTYIGLEPIKLKLSATLTLDPTATINTIWAVYFLKNGNVVEGSKYKLRINVNSIEVVNPTAITNISTNDVITLGIERLVGTGDVYLTDGNIILNKI